MIRCRSPFRTLFVTAGLVGSALVLVSAVERPEVGRGMSLSGLARMLMAPAFPAEEPVPSQPAAGDPQLARAEPGMPALSTPPELRIRAVPPVTPAPASVGDVAVEPNPRPTSAAPAMPETALPANDAQALPPEDAEAEIPAVTPGRSSEGEVHAGVRLSGFDRRLAGTLFRSGGAALVAELEDGRELRFLPGPSGGFADGQFVPWDTEAAGGFSNWHLPIGSPGAQALDAIDTVPVALIRARLVGFEPLARLERLSFALGPDLHAAVLRAEAEALAAVGLGPEDRSRLVLEGCWGKPDEPTIRVTSVRVVGGAGPEFRRIEGVPSCR